MSQTEYNRDYSIADGNRALRNGDYVEAIRAYTAALAADAAVAEQIEFNLSLAKWKRRRLRRGTPLHVAVCGWDLSHNAAGRVRALADLWSGIADTEIIGATFLKEGRDLWPPLRNMETPCHSISVENDAKFPEKAFELVRQHPYDVVHLSKPRFPNIIFGLLYKLIWDAQVIMDVDDEELGAVGADRTLEFDAVLEKSGGSGIWKSLGGRTWTQVSVGLWDRFDSVTTSNEALRKRYGGVVVPHARDAEVFTPSQNRQAANRKRLDIPEDKTVVLFFGTPRRHKGLVETAQALAALGRDDICFTIVGDFPDGELRRELEAVDGVETHFVGAQPYEEIHNVVAIGDICVLLQDDGSLLGKYQTPAKLTDALSMGLLVFAQHTEGLDSLVSAGAVVAVTRETLGRTLTAYLEDEKLFEEVRCRAREVFRDKLSIQACRNTVRELPLGRSLYSVPMRGKPPAGLRQDRIFRALGAWIAFSESDEPDVNIPNGERVPQPDNRAWSSLLRQWTLSGHTDTGTLEKPIREHLRRAYTFVDYDKNRKVPNEMYETAVNGAVALRLGDFPRARSYWSKYWEYAVTNGGASAHVSWKWYINKNADLFEIARRSCKERRSQQSGRYVVYTALFGEYDYLRSPLYTPEGIDYICFSDFERNVPGWEVRVIDTENNTEKFDAVAWNRYFKILPHEHFPDYDGSIYIDANLLVTGDFQWLIETWLHDKPFVGWMHPDRSNVYDEMEAILTNLRGKPDAVLAQAESLYRNGMPDHTGLLEAAFLWRRHDSENVNSLMEGWWQYVRQFRERDQPGLAFEMWRKGVRPEVMSPRFGNSRINDFTTKLPHRMTRLSPWSEGGNEMQVGVPQISEAKETKRELAFLYHSSFKNSGSTVMRVTQLAEIVQQYGVIGCRRFDEKQCQEITNSIVIVNKSFLKKCEPSELARLRNRGNILCADFVDDPPRKEIIEEVDVLISSSIAQHKHYLSTYPDKLSHMVTHHVDPRIQGTHSFNQYCRLGYFGELVNARHQSDLTDLVEFYGIDTKRSESKKPEWIERLTDVNVHYAVREHRSIDGFKPFLKGFTAAHCHSNVIVPLYEGDARYYLTAEYPYALQSGALTEVRDMVAYVHETFGRREWWDALEIMESVKRRSAYSWIAEEVRCLLNMVWGGVESRCEVGEDHVAEIHT